MPRMPGWVGLGVSDHWGCLLLAGTNHQLLSSEMISPAWMLQADRSLGVDGSSGASAPALLPATSGTRACWLVRRAPGQANKGWSLLFFRVSDKVLETSKSSLTEIYTVPSFSRFASNA